MSKPAIHLRLPEGRSNAANSYFYRAYGLTVDSDIELPWPPATVCNGEIDVAIRLGDVPLNLDPPKDQQGYWQAADGALLINPDGGPRWLVSDKGRLVRVAPAKGGDVGIHLADSVLTGCLQMRGALVLHASAIATAAGAILFMGPVGVGKSTLVAALTDCGYPLLADGIVAIVRDNNGNPLALDGFPTIRLWANSIDALDKTWRSRKAGSPIRAGVGNYAVPEGRFTGKAVAAHAVYVLSSTVDREVVVEPLSPGQAFSALLRNSFRMRFLRGLGEEASHFHAACAVVRCAAMQRLVRPLIGHPPAILAAKAVERLPPPA